MSLRPGSYRDMQGRIISVVAVVLALFIIAIVISPVVDIPLTTEQPKGARMPALAAPVAVALTLAAFMPAPDVVAWLHSWPFTAGLHRHLDLFNFTCVYLC